MDLFESKTKAILDCLERMRVKMYNSIQEGSMSPPRFRAIMEQLESMRQEAVSAADALGNN